MGTVPDRPALRAVEEMREVDRWAHFAGAIDVIKGRARYPDLDEALQNREAIQVLGMIAHGEVNAFIEYQAVRAVSVGD